ncbi:MAG: DUF6288 domain-containing protein [Opitutales bacterium]
MPLPLLKKSYLWALCLSVSSISCLQADSEKAAESERVYQLRPSEKSEMAIPYIGATGIVARIHRGLVVKVESLMPDSPAADKFAEGEILTGVNGIALQGKNPFVVLGEALTEAEATDGKLVFDVRSPDGKTARQQLVEVAVLGPYSDTWPLNCTKSEKIVREAANFFAQPQWLKDKGMPGALTALFLLSTGEDKYLPAVKAYFDGFPSDLEKIGDNTWNNGYNGIVAAEYYLRTGDKSVLPILKFFVDDAERRQFFGVAWKHWGTVINPRYVAGGLMNPASAQVLTTLLLAKECGLDVDEATLLGSLRYFYRFAGKGTVPYGDHRGEGGLGSNGKDGMVAAAMQVALGSSGDTTIYEKARQSLAMSMMTSYPSLVVGHGDNGRGDAIWRSLIAHYMKDLHPEQYREARDRLKWWHDLSRLPNGALEFGTLQWNAGELGSSGAGVGLSYTAPRKTLRITGAPRTKHSVDYELPEKLWGTEADLAFHQTDHHPKYYDYGEAEPTHIPYWTFGSAYWTPEWDPKVHTREAMLKNVYHRNYMIRAQAAKALLANGYIDELESLLDAPDPRVRRAAIDGLIDYRYWFGMGRNPIKTEQFTPGILQAVRRILSAPEESWWLVDGALMLLRQAPAEAIVECLPLIMPWIDHHDWWLREDAFIALSGLDKDPEQYREVLPIMLDLLKKENHTMPRDRMRNHFKAILRQHGPETEIGRTIIAGVKEAVQESEIKEGLQAREGAWNVLNAAKLCLERAPTTALAVGEMIRQRMDAFDTGSLITLVGTPNSNEATPSTGFYPALQSLEGEQRDALEALLYEVYRKEFLARLKEQERPYDQALVDTLVDLTQLRRDIDGWQALGTIKPEDRLWRFTTFDPLSEADEVPARERKRFRRIQLAEQLKDWFKVDFDDRAWRTGKAPIGKGPDEFRGSRILNTTDWGEGEFIVMRTTFEIDELNYDAYRLRILARQGYDVYLNGELVENYIWWKDRPAYRPFALSPEKTALLKRGTNVLAAYGNMEYHKHTKEPTGQMDLYIEGLRLSEILDE